MTVFWFTVDELVARARDEYGLPRLPADTLGWLEVELRAGRWASDGIPCDADGNPAGGRKLIPAGIWEVKIRFPFSSPRGYSQAFWNGPPHGRRAYAEIRVCRVDDRVAAAYAWLLARAKGEGRKLKIRDRQLRKECIAATVATGPQYEQAFHQLPELYRRIRPGRPPRNM